MHRLSSDIQSLNRDFDNDVFHVRPWPISDEEHVRMVRMAMRLYDAVCQDVDAVIRDVVVADVRFFFFLLEHMHAALVRARCDSLSWECEVGDYSRPVYDPDWDALGSAFSGPRLKRKAGLAVRTILRHQKHNKDYSLMQRLLGARSGNPCWAVGGKVRCFHEYVRRHNVYAHFPYLESLMPSVGPLDRSSRKEELLAVTEGLVSGLARLLPEECGAYFHVRTISEAYARRLDHLCLLYEGAQRLVRHVPRRLLLCKGAEQVPRVISLALQRRGTELVCFHHGSGMGELYWPVVSRLEGGVTDTMVFPTRACGENHKVVFEASSWKRHAPLRVYSSESEYFADIVAAGLEQERVKTIGTVMVVGYPMNAIRYAVGLGNFFYYMLDIELRVIKALKRSGFNVIYKAHPEHRGLVDRPFSDLGVEIDYGHFENSWKRADAFFFSSYSSTAFGVALCTNRPMCALALDTVPWVPGVVDLLQKRCTIISFSIDESNRPVVDVESIVQAFSGSQAEVNMEFVVANMLPDNSPLLVPGAI